MGGAPSNAIATPSTGPRVDEDRRLCDPHTHASTCSITAPITCLIHVLDHVLDHLGLTFCTRRDSARRPMTSHCLALVLSSQEIRMKNLVLGALLVAAVSSAACGTTSDTSARITASWSFNTYANRGNPATAPCPSSPVNYDTATVYVRPWDPFVGDFTGAAVPSDLFDCSAKTGTTGLLDGIFQVWVQIENHSGSSVYASSEAEVIDTADGDQSITLPPLFTDAGYFDLSWHLLRNGARVHCADAGIGSAGRISTSAVVSGTSTLIIDKFTCTDGFGISDPLPVDTYLVTVTASTMPGMDIGNSAPIDNVDITTPDVAPQHGLTHLGTVDITVQ